MKRIIILSLILSLVAIDAKAQDTRATALKGAPTIGVVQDTPAQTPDQPKVVRPGDTRFNPETRTLSYFDGMNWATLVTSSGGGSH